MDHVKRPYYYRETKGEGQNSKIHYYNLHNLLTQPNLKFGSLWFKDSIHLLLTNSSFRVQQKAIFVSSVWECDWNYIFLKFKILFLFKINFLIFLDRFDMLISNNFLK
jgi:hypothetical protein